MSRRRRLRQRVIATLVFGLASASFVAADYKRAYQEGYQLARQGRNWEIVAQRMTEAIQEHDREGEQIVLTSASTQPYLPYFYLGLARFHLGDCRGARENWIKTSVQKKVVLHGRERDWFNEFAPICELMVPIEDALAQANTRLQAATELANDSDLSPIWASDAALGGAATKARQDLTQVRASLDEARRAKTTHQQGLLMGVKAETDKLTEQLGTLLKTARSRRDDLVAQRHALERTVAEEKKVPAAREALTATNAPAPDKPGGGTPATSGTATPGAAAANAVGVAKPGEASVFTSPALATTTPPDALRLAAQHYTGGRYRQARQTLHMPAPAIPDQWRAHAALLRAGAAFALFYAEGQKDRALLDEARRAVLECVRAKPDVRPSRRLYPPHFIAFFEHTAGPSKGTGRAN